MNILIDIWHPADVHFFKNYISIAKKNGHRVIITARDKDVTIDLLKEFGLEYYPVTKKSKGAPGLFWEFVVHTYKVFWIAKKERADILLAFTGASIAWAGKLLGIPAIAFYDSEFAKIINWLTIPLITRICTPDVYKYDYGKKHIRFKGYKELAYLHPNHFRPDDNVYNLLGLSKGERYFLLRFVSSEASHDFNVRGLTNDEKINLVSYLSKYGKVFISSEDKKIPDSLKSYLLNIKPQYLFDVIYYAELVVSESATVATETAILGTPVIYLSSLMSGNLEEQIQKYKTIKKIDSAEELMKTLENFIADDNLKVEWRKKRDLLLQDKIDVSAWMADYIDNFCKNKI